MTSAIEIRGLGKQYRLGTDASGYDTIRDAIARTALRRTGTTRSVWALREVEFDVPQGQALGIVGSNGAGKTTLLKILAGITEPTSGEAWVRGRVGALLDVGTGFHPELTGRENVFLSGAILGLRRAEISALYEEIVEFAGVQQFMGTPVKRYSAGMRLRLAFAVAAYVQPAIVVIDEVLATGDAAFREKCLVRMGEISREQRTILFVSHDPAAISRACDRAIWLKDGRVERDGDVSETLASYLEVGIPDALAIDFDVSPGDLVSVVDASLRDPQGAPLTRLRRDQTFGVRIGLSIRDRIPGLDISVILRDGEGNTIIDDALSDHPEGQELGPGDALECTVTIPPLLTPGTYTLATWIGTPHEDLVVRDLLKFPVSPGPADSVYAISRRRAVAPPLDWAFTHGDRP